MTDKKEQKQILRINLGCGRKLLPMNQGWINVDVMDPPEIVMDNVAQISHVPYDPREITPKTEFLFHAADIKQMKFIADKSVHEVHAYHVIEHFEISELPQVFAEIKRILDPELGCVVLEQPNVIKCAKNFLQLETTKDPKVWYNLGLQGFYGDIEPGNVYSLHKWGWWPESLAEQLMKFGFKAVIQQEPKTHMGSQRDFRLVAFLNQVPAGIESMTDRAAVSPYTQAKGGMIQTKGVGVKNQATGKDEPLLVTPMDSVPQPDLLENIQTNINTIPKWLKRARVHTGKAIIASAGPSIRTHLEELKNRQKEGATIFCVKHSLPILLEYGIKPEFCVILDPRPLDGTSTHGIVRKDLFKDVPPETTMLVASMTNRDVTKHLLDRGVNVVGWHALANGIDRFISTGKIDLIIAGGTCSAMRAINVAYNLGFREVELVGFDCSQEEGWKPDPKDLQSTDERNRPKYIEIFYKDANKKFYSTGELVAQAQDLIGTFENPNDMMFNVWDNSNYLSEIWKDFKDKFKPLDEYDPKKVSK
jgi:predicted SAM-dependent methyltransferase